MRRILLCATAALALACAPPAPRPIALAWKHVSFAVNSDYDAGTDLAVVARDFGLFRRLGITTWRGRISWRQAEPTRGAYDFAWLHRFLLRAADSAIVVRPYVDDTPPWGARGGSDSDASNDPPRSIAEWSAFVRALAIELRHHDGVRSLEIYDEENVAPSWDGSAAAYDSVLAAAATELRATAPRLGLSFGGMAWPDASWATHACAAARVDVVPFHAYPETRTADTVTVESWLHDVGYDAFLETVRASCRRAPVWIDAAGFATTKRRTERDQALWWARAIPSFLAARSIEHVGVYEISDRRTDRGMADSTERPLFGLVDSIGRPKLAFSTVRTLVRMLGTDSLVVLDTLLATRVAAGSERGVYVHAFLRPDGRQVIAAWTRAGQATVDVRLPWEGRDAAAWSLEGRPSPAGGYDGRTLRLQLRPDDVRLVVIAGTQFH